jgi:hypothetical protein
MIEPITKEMLMVTVVMETAHPIATVVISNVITV